ncbi:MAG: acyltransferase family protein [Actinomycetota bacterium]
MSGTGFRADLQGLRAVAIVMVVLYHADVPGFSGGFVGVDVFFALSGFVIGASILREVDATGRLSLRNFYLRRVRRLLPAFVVAAMATWVGVALFLEVGEQQRAAAATGIAAAFSVGNLQLWSSPGGYFSPAEDLNPFLHTWSLGVEEQFYLVVPAVLVVLVMVARRTRWTPQRVIVVSIACLCVLSFAASVDAVRSGNTRAAFYNPLLRFWEIGAGMVLAAAPTVRKRIAAPVAVVGWACMLLPVGWYGSSTDFPGLAAVPVVLGTLAVISATPHVGVRRVLESRTATWIGDRSYGWYLWHWPFIVFARTVWGSDVPVLLVAGVVALVPAALSHRYVESPFRRRRGRSRRVVAAGAIAALGVAATGGGVATAADNDWWLELDWARRDGIVMPSQCADLRGECRFDVTGGDLIVVVGDSHAPAIADGLVPGANAAGFSVLVLARSACPFLELEIDTADHDRCRELRRTAWQAIENERPAAVVMVQDAAGYVNRSTDDPLVMSAGRVARNPDQVADLWITALDDTRRRLDRLGIGLVSVDTVPTWSDRFAQTSITLLRRQRPELTMSSNDLAAQRTVVDRERDVLRTGATIDPAEVLCDPVCSTRSSAGLSRYSDQSHLSPQGARELRDLFERRLPGAVASANPTWQRRARSDG